ncbi:MAG: ECF-type sigma factor [Planctomycetota bacterium]
MHDTLTPHPDDLTGLLASAKKDPAAADALTARLYDELRALANRLMQGQPAGHTLQPTALVHEAWLRLANAESAPSDRMHFVRLAAKAMRQILVDHARRRQAEKRGGGRRRVSLDAALAWFEDRALDLVALDTGLEQLAARDGRQAQLVELRFFGGLSIAEAAQALSVSTATAERDWAVARAFLFRELSDEDKP